MKIAVNTKGREYSVRLPLALALSFVSMKVKRGGKEKSVRLGFSERRKIRAALGQAKAQYGDLAIIEVDAADGTNVTIRL